jgi:multicomponent Na+:H+ antiporter subunit B
MVLKMKMLKNFPIVNIVTIFVLPYIFLYALYIQINGETSPGGGFQAGVLFASALIAYEVIHGNNLLKEQLQINTLIILSVLGVMIYASVGVISLFFGSNYLDYYALAKEPHFAQELGIFTIEIGIGLTVSSVMCLIYMMFQSEL